MIKSAKGNSRAARAPSGVSKHLVGFVGELVCQSDRQRETEIDGDRGTHRHRQTDRQTDTDTDTHRHTDTHRVRAMA